LGTRFAISGESVNNSMSRQENTERRDRYWCRCWIEKSSNYISSSNRQQTWQTLNSQLWVTNFEVFASTWSPIQYYLRRPNSEHRQDVAMEKRETETNV
jgi:hypothetical protein